MKKQTQQQRDFDQIIDKWDDAEDEVFRLQTLNMQLQQDYNRAWERLKSQRREIDELQKSWNNTSGWNTRSKHCLESKCSKLYKTLRIS